MDIDKYLKQLQQDLNNQLTDLGIEDKTKSFQNKKLCPYCAAELLADADFCPYCGNEISNEEPEKQDRQKEKETPKVEFQSIYKLQRYTELEEETKSKIGTFERIYQQTYELETGKRLVSKFSEGYEVLDFASLVNLLASAIEAELKASVLPFMRKEYGKNYFFTRNGQTICLKEKFLSLRAYQSCLFHDCDNHLGLEKYGLKFHRVWESLKVLDEIIPIRNKADHTENIDEETFFKFYEYVYTFFEEYMNELILLKINMKDSLSPDQEEMKKSFNTENEFPWQKIFSDKTLSAEDKAYLNSLAEDDEEYTFEDESWDEIVPSKKKGIIITNTRFLAQKFFDKDTINIDGEEIDCYKIIGYYLRDFIEKIDSYTYYKLVDITFEDTTDFKSWQSYARILNKTYDEVAKNDEPIGLFIIGGNDVIPMPQVLNPLNDGSLSEKYLEADMLYAYYDEHIKSLTFENGQVDALALMKQKPRFWVGRLPLENGLVEDDFTNFKNYFDRVLNEYIPKETDDKKPGIVIQKHIATTCESAELVAKRVLEGIPLQPQDKRVGFIKDRMFISPGLDLRVDGSRKEDYKEIVKEADMQTFILHGSAYPSMECYYGESKDKSGHGYLAFTPELFDYSKLKVVSGICCWGGRYIGFPRMQSAVLKAIYSNVLLFLGSCRSACGTFDVHIEKLGCDIALAEVLLKYYLNFLLQGYDAGEALGRAKMLQLSNPDCEDINMVLGTILEFNLFGDPLLSLVPLLPRRPIEIIGSCEISDDFADNHTYQLEFDKEQEEHMSLLERLRKKVDKNLQDIKNKVNEQLYADYKIESETLKTIHSYQSKLGPKQYRFCYCKQEDLYENKTIVNTDDRGNVKNIISSI